MIDSTDIINKLRSHSAEHNKALTAIYNSKEIKSMIISFLKSKGLSKNDCNILWTDIVVKFALLVRNGKYEHQGKMMGYIKNLANYMFLNYIRDNKKSNTEELNDGTAKDHVVNGYTMYHQELKDLLERQLSMIGETCKSTLFLWSQGFAMKDIMEKLSFVSVESTRKRKHSCLQKLLRLVDDNPKLADTLKDYYNAISN